MPLGAYMRTLLLLIFVYSESIQALETGDIILQPLKCWSCSLIEAQENSRFSHMGMAIVENGEVFVLEAYGKVQLKKLSDFLAKTQSDEKIQVRRFPHLSKAQKIKISELSRNLIGNAYDAEFLWDNFDQDKEKLYCSELVYKILDQVIKLDDLEPKVMLFDINPELWDRFFKGETPRGHLGISPADFEHSLDFYDVELK